MKTKLNMEEHALSELHPAEYHPRVMLVPEDEEYQRIRRSIEEYGYVDPIIINSDGTIIGGHQRYKILLGTIRRTWLSWIWKKTRKKP